MEQELRVRINGKVGDKIAVNGTAKVILQGRKYGLGSFVITQRTANISKSILNQCNTIFALRIFDDTGKHYEAKETRYSHKIQKHVIYRKIIYA